MTIPGLSLVRSRSSSTGGRRRSWRTNAWHWRKVEEASLAGYVNAHCAAEAVPAIEPDGDRTVRDMLDDGDRLAVAELLYQRIAEQEIDYDLEGYVPDTEAVQRIRTPIEIWERRRATCLDLALLYAACSLNEGLRPLVIVLDGHALVAIVDTDFDLPLLEPSRDRSMLTGWIEQGSVVPIECTGMTNGEDLDFDFSAARQAGREVIEANALDFFLDPVQLHQDGRVEPVPCHPTPVGRIVVSVALALALLAGGLWWLSRPGPPVMPITGGPNLAVMPFAVVGAGLDDDDGVAVANQLSLQLRQEFGSRGELQTGDQPGWEIWGPTQLSEDGDGPLLGADLGSELSERNIDVAVYGVVEEANDRTFTDVNVWFQPSQRAALAGLSGPIEVRRDDLGTNSTVAELARDLAGELDGWFTLLSGLGLLQDATGVDDLFAAKERFDQAAAVGASSADGRHLQALAETMVGGTHLLIDATIRPDAEQARRLNLGLAAGAYESAIDLAAGSQAADRFDVAARAHLGLAQVAMVRSGCRPDGHDEAALRRADAEIAAAKDLGPPDGTVEPHEIWLKATLAEGWVAWCRWSAGLADGTDSLALLDIVIDNYADRSAGHERQRAEILAGQAYGLRALITGYDPDLADPEASLADARQALCLAPELSITFMRDVIREDLHTRYPDLPKESCRD